MNQEIVCEHDFHNYTSEKKNIRRHRSSSGIIAVAILHQPEANQTHQNPKTGATDRLQAS